MCGSGCLYPLPPLSYACSITFLWRDADVFARLERETRVFLKENAQSLDTLAIRLDALSLPRPRPSSWLCECRAPICPSREDITPGFGLRPCIRRRGEPAARQSKKCKTNPKHKRQLGAQRDGRQNAPDQQASCPPPRAPSVSHPKAISGASSCFIPTT